MFFLPGLFSIPRLTISILMSLLMVGALLWVAFTLYVTQSTPDARGEVTNAVVVLTGGAGRTAAGFQIIAEGRAEKLLITGVGNQTSLRDLLAGNITKEDIKAAVLKHCCVTLGYAAETTQDNAAETLEWMAKNNVPMNATIRLVTSDYHMPRALLQFRRALPEATIYPWPVKSNYEDRAFWYNLNREFGKYILTWLSDQAEQAS
ncbi:MAG TPA: YdcF family protein [Alphaproteobacteria bacterium]